MRVKIIKSNTENWYHKQIDSILYVENDPNSFWYNFIPSYNNIFGILKEDCEMLPDETPQPEPFDLERALKGEKVVEKDGRHVKLIGISEFIEYPIFWTIADALGILKFIRTDRMGISQGTTPYTLLMAPKEPKTVTKWVNLYYEGNFVSGVYNSKKDAQEDAESTGYFGTYSIQITIP